MPFQVSKYMFWRSQSDMEHGDVLSNVKELVQNLSQEALSYINTL